MHFKGMEAIGLSVPEAAGFFGAQDFRDAGLYDILFKKPPLNVDVGSDDDLDDIPDDAAEFIAAQKSAGTAQPEA